MDVFREKIQTVHIGDHFPKFNGKSCTVHNSCDTTKTHSKYLDTKNPIQCCFFLCTPGFRRDYDSGIQFIESLYVSDKRCHLSFPYFSLLERTWERVWKNKDNDKEDGLALHGSFFLFFTLPEPFCVHIFFIFFLFLTPGAGRRNRAIRYFVTRLVPQVIS